MILHAQISQRRPSVLDAPPLTEGVNIDSVEFSFDDEWQDYIKTAAFEIDGKIYTSLIDPITNSTLTLTFPEGMKKATDGSEAKYIHFRFSLSGSGKIILPSDLMYPRAFTQFSTGQTYEVSVCQGFAVIVPFVKKGAS